MKKTDTDSDMPWPSDPALVTAVTTALRSMTGPVQPAKTPVQPTAAPVPTAAQAGKSTASAPKTGDESNMLLWVWIMGATAAAAVCTGSAMRRRRKS